MSSLKSPAIFLDRDGTIIEDVGVIKDTSQVAFYDGAVNALKLLSRYFKLFIITNQPAVANGLLTHADVEKVHQFICKRLRQNGVSIEGIYYCPHNREAGCACIKPNTYFIDKAAKLHNLDIAKSFVIGDHPHDMELAYNAGAKGIYVLTGHGRKHLSDLRAHCQVVEDITEAAEIVFASAIP